MSHCCNHPGIPYKVCFADKDVEGSALIGILRADCYVREPGSCDFVKFGEVPFNSIDSIIRYFPPKDGDYAFYSRTIVSSGSSGACKGSTTDVIASEPSDVTIVTINSAAPAKPPSGHAAFDACCEPKKPCK